MCANPKCRGKRRRDHFATATYLMEDDRQLVHSIDSLFLSAAVSDGFCAEKFDHVLIRFFPFVPSIQLTICYSTWKMMIQELDDNQVVTNCMRLLVERSGKDKPTEERPPDPMC